MNVNILWKFKRTMNKKRKAFRRQNAVEGKGSNRNLLGPPRNGEMRIISVSSDEDDSDIDIDPDSEIVDKYVL